MLHSIYRIAGGFVLPGVALGLLASRRGRARYGERFGGWETVPGSPWWFHGASVGEVQGLLPLLRLVRERYPGERLLLTGTSVTGLERGAGAVDYTRIIPIDSPPLVRRAVSRVSPSRLIISETELWPELLAQVMSRGVPTAIVNGRISDYTMTWYRRLRSIFAPLISRCSVICVPDEEQRARYLEMGAVPERLVVTGHTKYDSEPRHAGDARRVELRVKFFSSSTDRSRILVLGSVRPEEEGWWMDACQRAWSQGQDLRLIVAPRHQEKVGYFIQKLMERGVPFGLWSERASTPSAPERVLLLDTMGLLEEAYAAADLAFVGATLVDIGGHNPLEPAMYGVPVCVGPHIAVIRTIVEEMEGVGGILRVSSTQDIERVVQQLTKSDSALRETGHAGQQVWQRHRGAAERVLQQVVKG